MECGIKGLEIAIANKDFESHVGDYAQLLNVVWKMKDKLEHGYVEMIMGHVVSNHINSLMYPIACKSIF